MANEWKVGDRVQLNSGGPIMTVDSFTTLGVLCQWFVEGKKLEWGTFQAAALRSPPSPGSAVVRRQEPDLF